MKYRYIALLSLLAAVSCQKPAPIINTKDVVKDVVVDVPIAPAGYYTFNGEDYCFYSVKSTITEEWSEIIIAREPQEPYNSVFYFALSNEFLNKEMDINRLYKRVDYRMIFETPSVYYPEYYAPRSGRICLREDENGNLKLDADLILSDGKPFSIHY